MKIKKMFIKNFKGIKELTLNFEGKNVMIYGCNESRKTTIMDAYLYAITGKDSQGFSEDKFGITPQDKNNKKRHDLVTIVEIEFVEPNITVRKEYMAVFAKVKGIQPTEPISHVTNYYINSKKYPATSFKKEMDNICPENISKMLSDVTYFTSDKLMPWKERRNILFQIMGDIPELDILFRYQEELEGLKDLLGSNSVDDLLGIKIRENKESIKQQDKINIQILEQQNSLQDDSNLDLEDLQEALEACRQNKKLKFEGNTTSAITSIEMEIQKLTNEFNKKQVDVSFEKHKKCMKLTKERDIIQNEISKNEITILNLQNEISKVTKEINKKREVYKALLDLTYEIPASNVDTLCPTCGNVIPIEKLKDTFNYEKSQNLEKYKKEGLDLTADFKILNQNLADVTLKNSELLKTLSRISEEIKEYTVDEDKQDNIEDNEKYKELILKLRNNKLTEEDSDTLKAKEVLDILEKTEAEVTEKIIIIKTNEKIKSRIKELQDKLSGIYADILEQNRVIGLCSKFGKIKIQESETLINSKFKSIKWKLFNELISQEDGAPKVSECCIPTYIGIDFVGASTSRSIKIGLEIIKVLSEYYNIRMPVFIDNCESISEIPVIESQMIQLRVSPQDKQMRSEVGGWYE